MCARRARVDGGKGKYRWVEGSVRVDGSTWIVGHPSMHPSIHPFYTPFHTPIKTSIHTPFHTPIHTSIQTSVTRSKARREDWAGSRPIMSKFWWQTPRKAMTNPPRLLLVFFPFFIIFLFSFSCFIFMS